MLSTGDIFLIVLVVVGVIVGGLFLLNRWAVKKVGEQEDVIAKTKQSASIYVIDKRRAKASTVNLPKVVMDNLPKWSKFMKMPFVKAKIGPQILTLICDKKVFNALPVKKNVRVELSGIYIVEMKGMKTEKELKDMKAMKEKANAKDGGKKPWYKFFAK